MACGLCSPYYDNGEEGRGKNIDRKMATWATKEVRYVLNFLSSVLLLTLMHQSKFVVHIDLRAVCSESTNLSIISSILMKLV